MKILWFNWRDIKNPEAGGAEVFTHEVAKRLVEKGHEVTLFTAKFKGAKNEEEIDGVHVVRAGNKYTVYRKAKEYWKRKFSREGYDIVIDEINTRPFMAPKFVKDTKIVALIHQLAREFWFYETPFPLSYVGYYILEPYWLKHYVNIPTITVSESTKRDLESLGFRKVYVVPEGLNVKPLNEVPKKVDFPLIVFLGRLKRAKRPDHAIEAFKLVKKEIPDAELWIIGDGYLRKKLEKMVFDGIKLLGRVSHEEKIEILKKAWVLVHPGLREGWGLNVIEANAFGTPVVAYDVPGLRDSVRHMETGILIKNGSKEELARGIIMLVKDHNLRQKLSKASLEYAKRFSWNKTARVWSLLINKILYKGDSYGKEPL